VASAPFPFSAQRHTPITISPSTHGGVGSLEADDATAGAVDADAAGAEVSDAVAEGITELAAVTEADPEEDVGSRTFGADDAPAAAQASGNASPQMDKARAKTLQS